MPVSASTPTASTSTSTSGGEHRVELPENPTTCLNLVAMAADRWGGLWQAEGQHGGRLGLPVEAGLRQGWVAGQVTVEPTDLGSRLTFRPDKSDYKIQKPAAFVLLLAAAGAATMLVAPLVPKLWSVVPFGIILSVVGWFFVVARLRNSGPEEFFARLAQDTHEEQNLPAGE